MYNASVFVNTIIIIIFQIAKSQDAPKKYIFPVDGPSIPSCGVVLWFWWRWWMGHLEQRKRSHLNDDSARWLLCDGYHLNGKIKCRREAYIFWRPLFISNYEMLYKNIICIFSIYILIICFHTHTCSSNVNENLDTLELHMHILTGCDHSFAFLYLR